MPIMSSVVMTGRRTKGPVRLMRQTSGSGASAAAAATTAAAAATAAAATTATTRAARTARGCGVIGRATDAHRRVRRQTKMPLGHDAIAVANTARHDREAARCAFDDHRALARGIRLIDDIDVGAALTRHDRLLRHDERVLFIEEMQRGRCELAWPEPAIGVVESRLELNGARGRIDRVVDERQLARQPIADDTTLLHRAGTAIRGAIRATAV